MSYEYIPVSIGELLDKISILEIKMDRIPDEGKKSKVIEELGLLTKQVQGYNSIDVKYFLGALKEINVVIWDAVDFLHTEDAKPLWRRNPFKITSLARTIYRQNDERARLKRDANLRFGSTLVEQKHYSVGEV